MSKQRTCFEVMEEIISENPRQIQRKIRRTLQKAYEELSVINLISDKSIRQKALIAYWDYLCKRIKSDCNFEPKVEEFVLTCVCAKYRTFLRSANGINSKYDERVG